MAHFPVSVLMVLKGDWQLTKSCLENLRPTMGIHDEVIVVDNGTTDDTSSRLSTFPWTKVIRNDIAVDASVALSQALEEAKGDVVVLLDNDVMPTSRWLDHLTAAFRDSDVAATGARSNIAPGTQFVAESNYSRQGLSSYRRFAKDWQQKHAGQTRDVPNLAPFCVAFRRTALVEVREAFNGRSMEQCISGICAALRKNEGRLVVCDDVYLHRADSDVNQAVSNPARFGFASNENRDNKRPLLSACMIVKDEVDVLSECLNSLAGVVDEVVVYDTGSTDGTIELARTLGAKVIEGYWDDDFGRARNASLDHCTGEWVLHIDADETVEGDPIRIRQMLMELEGRVDGLLVPIQNLSDTGRHDVVHRATRLFRNDKIHWVGRLHEQVVYRDGSGSPVGMEAGEMKIIHSGYLTEIVERKGKAERNTRISELESTEDDRIDEMHRLTNYGRSLTVANRNEEALAVFAKAKMLKPDSMTIWRVLLRSGAQAAIALNRPDEAIKWVNELAEASFHQDSAAYLYGQAYTLKGEWQRVIDVLEPIGLRELEDDDGLVWPTYSSHFRLAMAYAQVGRWEDAADRITVVATADSHEEQIWSLVAESYWRTQRDMHELFLAVPKKHMNAVFGQLVGAPPEASDFALEGLWQFAERRNNVLALAIRIAPHLSVTRAFEWSVRLREYGLDEHCPLITLGWDNEREPLDRIRATASAYAAFSDERASSPLKFAAGVLEVGQFENALHEVHNLDSTLLPDLVMAAATTPERSIAIGKVLFDNGADNEGVALLMHGLEQGADSKLAADAAAWLESVGYSDEAAVARQAAGR